MKRSFFGLLFIVALTLGSCSSSDDSTTDVAAGFTIVYEGVTYELTNINAIRVEDNLGVTGQTEDGNVFIQVLFNSNGDLGEVRSSVFPGTDTPLPDASTFYFYSSFYMDFDLVEINEGDQTFAIQFDGTLFEEEFVIDSPTFTMSGSYNGPYTEVDPGIPGEGVSAVVNGNTWIAVDDTQSGGFFSGSDVTHNFYSDDQYSISIESNHDNTVTGTYDFSATDEVNRIIVTKWDTDAQIAVDLPTTGTLIIEQKNVGPLETEFSGTFTVTAEDTDGSTITVTDGQFYYLYRNY